MIKIPFASPLCLALLVRPTSGMIPSVTIFMFRSSVSRLASRAKLAFTIIFFKTKYLEYYYDYIGLKVHNGRSVRRT